MSIPHLPVLRLGRAYESLDKVEVKDHRTGEVMALVSTVNGGIVKRDLAKISSARTALKKFTVAQLMEMSAQAGDLFLNGTLPFGDQGHSQSPQQYIETLSQTSGLPHVMVKRNMTKIHFALTNMPFVLNGLSRGLDLSILDKGVGEQFGTKLSFFPTCSALGLVMPSNSPAVNSLWIPAISLKTPVVIKPGKEEPWTPYRLIQAFIGAGVPAEAFGFYPTDHDGAATILNNCGRALIFGDKNTMAQYVNNPAIQLHGPGWSKFVIGEDCIEHWRDYLDVIAGAISDNGGRSCINASGVWVTRHADKIAEALAERLSTIRPRAADDPEAGIAPFANPEVGRRISGMVDAGLAEPGARDVSAQYRPERCVEWQGCTYVLPTIVRCDAPEHTLANKEYLFPFASVLEVAESEIPEVLGPTLVVTAITRNPLLINRLLASPHVGRLNIGAVPTNVISWDQPHEGNLFDHLYARRAFQMVEEPVLAWAAQ